MKSQAGDILMFYLVLHVNSHKSFFKTAEATP